jgi:hypothetical protein
VLLRLDPALRPVSWDEVESRLEPGNSEDRGVLERYGGERPQVAVSTQNQAFNALLFLYREVLHQEFGNVQAVRADRPVRVPVVLTKEEVKRVIGAMSGTTRLVVKLL